MPGLVGSFDTIAWRGLEALARRPLVAGLFLIALVIGCVLPGLLSLPPVDRTEVFFAGSARQLAEAGAWTGLDTARERKPVAPSGCSRWLLGSGWPRTQSQPIDCPRFC